MGLNSNYLALYQTQLDTCCYLTNPTHYHNMSGCGIANILHTLVRILLVLKSVSNFVNICI